MLLITGEAELCKARLASDLTMYLHADKSKPATIAEDSIVSVRCWLPGAYLLIRKDNYFAEVSIDKLRNIDPIRKFAIDRSPNGVTDYWFYCPGCKRNHRFTVGPAGEGPRWTFNGSLVEPTFEPSLLHKNECHLYMRKGMIQYLSDSKHELAGKIVECPNLPL